MRFLVDNQLPPALATWLRDQGHDSLHAFDVGLAHLDDRTLWAHAAADDRIVVSKDEDFLYLANQPEATGRLLWVRLGNCRNSPLLAAFSKAFGTVVAAFEGGQRVVELT
jgi:predicted nuclease of predicted toxin-antitoxin system